MMIVLFLQPLTNTPPIGELPPRVQALNISSLHQSNISASDFHHPQNQDKFFNIKKIKALFLLDLWKCPEKIR